MESSLSILRWWKNLQAHSPAMVYDPLAKAVDKAYGSLVEEFLDRWKRHSKQVFDALTPQNVAIRTCGTKLGQELAPWWISTRDGLWSDMCGYFGQAAAVVEQVPPESFLQMKRDILGAPDSFGLARIPQIAQLFDKWEGAFNLVRSLKSMFDPAQKNSAAASLINSWWERCSRAIEEFTSEPMSRALLSAIGFGDPNLVTCNALSPHPDSFRANFAGDAPMQWFVFPEQPPDLRSVFTRIPRKEIALAITGQSPEFAKAVEETTQAVAKNIWAKKAPDLNAFHQMQARSAWVACKALDLLLQPSALSDIAVSQEWFWQVGVTFDDWMKGRLGLKPPDNLSLDSTFVTCVYSIVDSKIHPNWVARVSNGQTLTSQRAEPLARLISFVMQRLAQWEGEQGPDAPAPTMRSLPPISLKVCPAQRRRSYWLVVNNRDHQRKPITEAVVDLFEIFNAGDAGKDVSYDVVQQIRNTSKLIFTRMQIGKKVGNRVQSVSAPSLANCISIERHPPRPVRQPIR